MAPLLTVPVLNVLSATPRSKLLTLDTRQDELPFRPGQAVVIGDHGQPLRRPYSIASSPERARRSRALELLIGLDASGSSGSHLKALQAGSLLDMEGPSGSFVLPDQFAEHRLMFVGGGTGIAPLRSMIDHVLEIGGTQPMALLYSARGPDEFAFLDEFRARADERRLELHLTVTRSAEGWNGGTGRISRSHFEAVLHDPQSTLCFVCGPATMVNDAVLTLATLGVPGDAIRTEMWTARNQA